MRSLALILLLAAPAGASTLQQLDLYTSSANFRVTGSIGVAASTATPTNYKFIINGPGGYLQFPDGTRQTTAGGGGGGSSTITVNTSQFSGNGSPGAPLTLLSSSVTLQGNSFNGNSQLVKTNASGVIPLSITGSANSASVAAVATTALSASSAAYATTAASADYALAAASLSSSLNPIFIYPGIEVNLSPGYGLNRTYVTTTSIDASYYQYPEPRSTTMTFDHNGLFLSSGIVAGVGRTYGFPGVQIINSDGKIPAITSDYFASLDGSAITGLSTLDTTKVPLGGGTMSGSLIFDPTSISTGNIVFQGAYPHSIKFDNHSGTTNQFLGEMDFLQNGTGRHRIIGYGDTHSTQPKGLYIGATTTGSGTNIRLSGSVTENPDLVVSSWTSVGLNTASPNASYVLDANGKINSTGYYLNGIPFTGGSGSGSTVTVNTSQMSGDGSQSAPITLLSSSVTLQGNTFSISGIAASTGAIQTSLNAVIFSTGAIYSALNSTAAALTAEISRATTRENAIGASTGTIQTSLNSVILSTGSIQASLNSVILSTGSIYSALNSTAASLTAEISRATTRENAIGASTGTIQSSLNSVIASTAPLARYTNWDTAYGWGNHATAGYANAAAVGTATATLRTDLTSVATSTGVIYAALNSTAAALTSEISRATTRENAIAASTGTIFNTAMFLASSQTVTGYNVFTSSNVFQKAFAQTRLYYSNGIPKDSTSVSAYPGWVFSSNGGGGFTTNINNLKANDGAYATSTGAYTAGSYVSLANGTFGFNIPSTATILGVQVNVGRYQDSGGTANDTLCLMINNVQSNYCKASGTIPTTRVDVSYGDNGDLWFTNPYGNAPLTPANVNASGFGVIDSIIWQSGQTGAKAVYTDYYSITVWYTADDYFSTGYDLAATSSSFNVKWKQNTIMSVSSDSVVYASGFSGDGSRLTNLGSATDNTKVLKTGDTMTGQLTINGSSLTVNGNAQSSNFATNTSSATQFCLTGASGNCISSWPQAGTNLFFTSSPTDSGYYLAMSTAYPGGNTSTTTVTGTTSDILISSYVYRGFTASFINGGLWEVHSMGYVDQVLGYKSAQVYYKIYTSSGTLGATETLIVQTDNSSVLTTISQDIDVHGYAGDYVFTPGNAIIVKSYTLITGSGNNPQVSVTRMGSYGSHLAIPSSNASIVTNTGFVPGSGILNNAAYAIKTSSDMVANAYYGDGSKLTGINATSGGTPIFNVDNLYSQTNGANTVFYLSSVPVNNSLELTKNGIRLVSPSDYTIATTTITMVSAPASSTTLVASYVVGYSSLTIANVTGTNNNWSGSNSFSVVPTGITNSSYTMITAGATHSVTTFACISGSTIAITTAGNTRVMVGLTAGVAVSGSMSPITGYLVDGLDVNGQSSTAGRIQVTAGTASWGYNLSFTDITPVLSAGVHYFCAKIRADTAGTITIGSSISKPSFWVQELR